MFADAVFEGIGVVDFSAMEVELVVDEEVVEDIRDLDDVESEEVETFLGDVVEELELDNVDVLREVDTLVEADVVVVEAVETVVDIRGVAETDNLNRVRKSDVQGSMELQKANLDNEHL
ncbi:Protein CBG26799 [Caenorhabditis briggsae]|uniref:Protein CBG26799 n=1 Tax=Caenorhabditis briggsae TaxID=6238 RepID=B6IHY5_CAEBR|nr:Protein CBG26799 [Caenorhabditis briggsae]CAR99515.1 Protein CBG26799 [Caenorhabditis briggsae]